MGRLPIELTIFLALLFGIPAYLVLPGFGAAGAPASLMALIMLVLLTLGWALPQLSEPRPHRRAQRLNPVSVALAGYVAMVLASWTSGKLRPLSALAGTTSDRALITVASLAALALFVISRVREERTIIRLIDALLVGTTFMCAIGLVQFFASHDLSTLLRVPGLESLRSSKGIGTRSIFNRPSGTALHPIEFGVVAAATVPLAWWRARRGNTVRHWLIVGTIAFSAMTALSRSAILVLAIAGLVLFVGSSWRERATLVGAGCAFVVASWVAIPGLLGTLLSLFQGTGNDPSIQARLDRTPEVLRLMTEHLWFGRGFGTFTIDEYLLLDNEIQKMAIETGLVGVAVFVVFIVTVVWAAGVTASRRVGTLTEGLPLALMASALGIAVSFYTFDAFYYHILTAVMYLNIGLVGSLWNLDDASPSTRPVLLGYYSARVAEKTYTSRSQNDRA